MRRTRHAGGHGGFSLVETLVVLAIISILMAMLATSLTKAVRMAKGAAAGEAMRQGAISRMADTGPARTLSADQEIRLDARRAFRQAIDTGKGQMLLSELRYVVRNNAEFRAYWHTLLNPAASFPLTFADGGSLVARGPGGKEFVLPPIGTRGADRLGRYAVGWEFISTNLAQTARGDLGGNVIYNDGHRQYELYPGRFPMSEPVARLSQQFVDGI